MGGLLDAHDGFFKPFADVFLCSCVELPAAFRDVVYADLAARMNTSWGGARVTNAALGTNLP
eukprot:1252649-Pyramimonas_sp.AAC.1